MEPLNEAPTKRARTWTVRQRVQARLLFDTAAPISGKLLEQKNSKYGFDAQNEIYCDLVEAGIIDPAKVVRTALQDAASVSGLMITTEVMVTDSLEEIDRQNAMQMASAASGGGMGGMGF